VIYTDDNGDLWHADPQTGKKTKMTKGDNGKLSDEDRAKALREFAVPKLVTK
jgi:hypothetical protein